MNLLNHFDISGNNFNELHSEKIPQIFIIFLVFQLEISNNNFKEKQFEKRKLILIRLCVIHEDNSGKNLID